MLCNITDNKSGLFMGDKSKITKEKTMNSNEHKHSIKMEEIELPKAHVSGLWVIGAVGSLILVSGVLYMGYTLAMKEMKLTEFQAFVSVILGALTAGVGAIFGKMTIEKNKDREFKKWQIVKTMEHEEIIEKTRMQTNGRLHKRDELIGYQVKLDEKKNQKIELLQNADENDPEVVKTLIKINSDISYLEGVVMECSKELLSLKPFYPKEDSAN